jgi:hypothetical protein
MVAMDFAGQEEKVDSIVLGRYNQLILPRAGVSVWLWISIFDPNG